MGRLLSWAHKGFFAVLDQGIFAGANFLVNVLLARWLEPVKYGAFAIAYSVFLLIGALHAALITEPMMVFGAGKYSGKPREYLGIVVRCHLYLVIPITAILAALAVIFRYLYSHDVMAALLALALSAPVVLLMWVLRHALYVSLRSDIAALGSLVYFIIFTGLVAMTYWMRALSATTALLCMGLSALPVCLVFIKYLQPKWGTAENPGFSSVPKDHWSYGRWALGTAALMWIPGNIYFLVLPVWLGLEGVAALKAVMNFILPMLNVISVLSLLLLPVFSRNIRMEPRRIPGIIKRCLIILFSASAAYFIILVIFKVPLAHLLYRTKYDSFLYLIPVLCLLPFGASLTAVMGSVLRATESPDKVFLSYIGPGVFSLTFGVALAAILALTGAVAGLIISSVLTGITMSILYRRFGKKPQLIGNVNLEEWSA
ncbi:MAG: hypothetical protein WC592_06580 [Candidatus Omnitrophota bacterium]